MYNLENWQTFLAALLAKLKELKIDVSSCQLDHIAYRTTSKQEYEEAKEEFKQLGELLPEVIIRHRRIAIIKLKVPLTYQNYRIEALELLEPAEGDRFRTGFEHAEFVITQKLSDLMEKYPKLDWNTKALARVNNPELGLRLGDNLGVKFHKMPILEARRIQEETGVL